MPNLKNHWLAFLATATWILTLIGTFLTGPPLISINEKPNYQPLLRFFIAAVLALTFILMRRYSGKKFYKVWLRLSFIAFIAGLITGVSYTILSINWSVKFYEDRLVIGEHLYADAARQKALLPAKLRLPRVDDETLVKAWAGDTASLWPRNEILQRYTILALHYVAATLLLSFFIVSVAKSIDCYQTKIR
jgi:hypothetical protein